MYQSNIFLYIKCIYLSIALPVSGYAQSRNAFEGIIVAYVTTAVLFIGKIVAVVHPVADEVFRDASTVATPELVCKTSNRVYITYLIVFLYMDWEVF